MRQRGADDELGCIRAVLRATVHCHSGIRYDAKVSYQHLSKLTLVLHLGYPSAELNDSNHHNNGCLLDVTGRMHTASRMIKNDISEHAGDASQYAILRLSGCLE